MSKETDFLRQLDEIAETNPEVLAASTPSDSKFHYIDLGTVKSGFIDWGGVVETTYRAAPSRARRVVQPMDVLFGTVRPNLQSHGFVKVKPSEVLVASTGFSVVRAKKGVSDPAYLYHSLMSDSVTAQAVRDAVGSNYPAVNDGDVKKFKVFAPDYEEQVKIAEILDTLDEVIWGTEAIIAKLKNAKQGLLHDLLTRGIDANGELRPAQNKAPYLYNESLLGWIPKEWTCKPFGDLCESSAFGPRFPSDAYDENGPLATLRTTDMDGDGNISLSTMPRAAIAPSVFADHLLRPGDIVISRSGTCGVTGMFAGHDIPVVPGAFLIRFRLRDRRLSRFYHRYFNSFLGRPYLERLAVGGVQKNIKGSDVLCLQVPILTPEEAVEIAERIESVEHKIEGNQQLLKKLQLHKSGLMDDLLTGRKRVTALLHSQTAA